MSHKIKQELRNDITELENNLAKAKALSEYLSENNEDSLEELADKISGHLQTQLSDKLIRLKDIERADYLAALNG